MGDQELTISTQTLHADLGKPGHVILDVTWFSDKEAREDFRRAHIPGAQFVDVLSNAHSALFPRNIPDAAALQEQLRVAGVNRNSRIIVYDNAGQAGFFIGSRAAWTLRLFGCQKVAVLDGGLQKWIKDGFATTTEVTTPERGDIVCEYQSSLRTEYDKFVEKMNAGEVQVLDSRPIEVYEAGHVPGAINIPFADKLLNADKTTMKSVEELKKVFAEAGVNLDKPLVTMCNSGMSSCSLLLAARKCGSKDSSVFHGGMTEWKANNPECTKL